MPKWVCKYCGMITDNPDIVPCGIVKAGYKENDYEYKIQCPVCESVTFFYRDKPFPTDKPRSPVFRFDQD